MCIRDRSNTVQSPTSETERNDMIATNDMIAILPDMIVTVNDSTLKIIITGKRVKDIFNTTIQRKDYLMAHHIWLVKQFQKQATFMKILMKII